MKNTTTEKKLSKKTLKQLAQIAMNADYGLERRGDLEARNNDSEDFQEISVWAIQTMLENAYRLGMADAAKN